MSKWHGGKGSAQRAITDRGAYENNWDAIFGSKESTMKNNNGTWLPAGDTFFASRGDYESADYAAVLPYVKHKRIAIDIGAHVGYWSRRLVQDFDYVYAYEAEPTHVECLRVNVTQPNIQITQIALSDQPGTVQFSTSIANSGMSHVSNEGVSVACEPLDRWKHRDVDLIKIDVEGHELAVLQGAEHTILRNRPTLFIEILNSTPAEKRKQIIDLLHSWNYREVTSIAENYIFVSN